MSEFQLVKPTTEQFRYLTNLDLVFDICNKRYLQIANVLILVHPLAEIVRNKKSFQIPLGYISYRSRGNVFYISNLCDFSNTCVIKPYIENIEMFIGKIDDLVYEMIKVYHETIVVNGVSAYRAKNDDELEYFAGFLNYEPNFVNFLDANNIKKLSTYKLSNYDSYNLYKIIRTP